MPEPGHPDHAITLSAWDERTSALAVAHGLPAVGARMTNAHGIEWEVDRHEFVPSWMTNGRGIERGDDPRLLYPVVFPTNLRSERLGRMMAQLHLCTPKDLLTLDTVPHLRPDQAAPHGHFIDPFGDPRQILLFLDAGRAHETLIAHELGHVWVELIDGIEDYRVLADLSETVRAGQVQRLQSFVLDFAVNGLIRRKGFDMAPVLDDRRISLEQLAASVAAGYRPPSPWEGTLMARVIAETMVEDDGLPVRADAWERLRKDLPEEWALALGLAAAVRENPFVSPESAIRAIDRVLTLAFAHAGEHLDLERDLVHLVPETEWRDKWPGWLGGLEPWQKAEVGRAMARLDADPGSEIELRGSDGGTLARFGGDGSGWTGWTPVPFALPEPAAPIPVYANLRRLTTLPYLAATPKGVAPSRGPVPPPIPRAPRHLTPPSFPGTPGSPNTRAYSTGEGRFVTTVRLAEMLEGESAYGYALGNPTTYVDPSGLSPFSPCETSAYSDVASCRAQGHKSPLSLFRCCQRIEEASYDARIPLGWCQTCPGGRREVCEACAKASGLRIDCGNQPSAPVYGPGTTIPGVPLFPGVIKPWPDGGGLGYGSNFDIRGCEAACKLGCRPSGVGRKLCTDQCRHVCAKFANGGCNGLEEYCKTLEAGGRKNLAELCESAWNIAGCPGRIVSGG